jgi:hypothetical protein
MLHRVALVRTDVSEEPSASFIRATRIGEVGTTLAATRVVPISPILVALMKEALGSSEMSSKQNEIHFACRRSKSESDESCFPFCNSEEAETTSFASLTSTSFPEKGNKIKCLSSAQVFRDVVCPLCVYVCRPV